MGSKKGKKAADSVALGQVAASQVHESQIKKKKKKTTTTTTADKLVKPTSELDAVVGQQQAPMHPSAKPLKALSEIDDIFGQKKRKKAEGGQDDEAALAAAKKKDKGYSEVVKLNSKGELVRPKTLQMAKSTASAKSTSAAAASTSRKKTEDGFTVYSAEELGFNKKNAGGTKLCPFDCDCCF